MSGRLTTHVLDTSRGRPAEGMTVELWRYGAADGEAELLRTVLTNADGRVDAPLLQGQELTEGLYELVFSAGDYFRRISGSGTGFDTGSGSGSGLGIPGDNVIFDKIPIRFRVTSADSHYHIPLLAAPGGYSTYRGS